MSLIIYYLKEFCGCRRLCKKRQAIIIVENNNLLAVKILTHRRT